MRTPKLVESAVEYSDSVPVAAQRRGARTLALAALSAFVLVQGCSVFQPSPPSRPKPASRSEPVRTRKPVPPPPMIEEEELVGPPELEGPPLPPAPQAEEEIVGPQLPSPAADTAGGGAKHPASERPVPYVAAARFAPTTEALAAALSSKGIAAHVSQRGVVVVLPESLFEYGTADLPKASRRTLREIANAVTEEAAGASVSVEGHTDSIGAEMFNQGLSERRAKAIAAELVAAGVSKQRVASAGFGGRFPIAPNAHADGTDDPEGRARNRRVEIVIGTETAPRG